MNQPRPILLVEDLPQDVEAVRDAIEGTEFERRLVSVRDGAEALDYLYCRGKFHWRPKMTPAAILLDNKMPRVSGLEVLAAIRQDPQFKHLPVIMLTSSREDKDVLQSYQAGTNAYVVKPMDFDEFARNLTATLVFWAEVNEVPAEPAPEKNTL